MMGDPKRSTYKGTKEPLSKIVNFFSLVSKAGYFLGRPNIFIDYKNWICYSHSLVIIAMNFKKHLFVN